jgi:hypothetical protein
MTRLVMPQVGPLLGGAMVERFGFKLASSIFGIVIGGLLPCTLPCLCERDAPSEAVTPLAAPLFADAGGDEHAARQEGAACEGVAPLCSIQEPRSNGTAQTR